MLVPAFFVRMVRMIQKMVSEWLEGVFFNSIVINEDKVEIRINLTKSSIEQSSH
jgi:hypothetical protein